MVEEGLTLEFRRAVVLLLEKQGELTAANSYTVTAAGLNQSTVLPARVKEWLRNSRITFSPQGDSRQIVVLLEFPHCKQHSYSWLQPKPKENKP